tara:strand:+ start:101 stop:334 length:234 start_codon:yes stop_codon:yes gene_type:complete
MFDGCIVPVVVRHTDGSCLVAFPDGTRFATVGIDAAQEVVNHFYAEEQEAEEPKRRIGFRLSHNDEDVIPAPTPEQV